MLVGFAFLKHFIQSARKVALMIWALLIGVMLVASISSAQKFSRSPVLFFVVTFLIVISGVRYRTGYDFDAYESIHSIISGAKSPSGIEPGWILLNKIALLFVDSSVGVFALSSFMIYGVLAWVLHKEVKYAAVGILAFILQPHFYWESLSILRQYVAIALSVLAVYKWISGKTVAFVVMTLAAASFHAPAVIVLLMPVLINWSSRWSFVVISVVGGVAVTVFMPKFLNLFEILDKYRVYIDGTIPAEGRISTGLVVYVRVLVAALIIRQIDSLCCIDQNRKNLIANSLIFGYTLFFMFYESTALRRISYYFIIYEVFAISYIFGAAVRRGGGRCVCLSAFVVGIYFSFGSVLMIKDVWANPIGRQEESQQNYEYRTIFE